MDWWMDWGSRATSHAFEGRDVQVRTASPAAHTWTCQFLIVHHREIRPRVFQTGDTVLHVAVESRSSSTPAQNMFSHLAISRATHVDGLLRPPQMDFHPRVCKRGFVVWFVRRSLAALSCCWSKITVSRFINILRRIEELSGPWRGQEGAGGEDCWVCQQFKQSRWINTNKPRRRRQIIAPILFYFIFLVVVVVVFLQWVFFSLLRGSYWLEVGSFFPSSNQKQEQGFSEELSHIPSACVLSIKRDVACGALLHFISLFISFTNAWTVEYCIG